MYGRITVLRHTAYPGLCVVDGVSLELLENEHLRGCRRICCGKTTLIKVIPAR